MSLSLLNRKTEVGKTLERIWKFFLKETHSIYRLDISYYTSQTGIVNAVVVPGTQDLYDVPSS